MENNSLASNLKVFHFGKLSILYFGKSFPKLTSYNTSLPQE